MISVDNACESTLVVVVMALAAKVDGDATTVGIPATERIGAVDISDVVGSILIKSNVPSGVELAVPSLTLDDSGCRRGLLLGGVLPNITSDHDQRSLSMANPNLIPN